MTTPIAKRRVLQGPGVLTRSKRSKTNEGSQLTLIDAEGYVNVDGVWDAFMPEDMAKWLPKPMVDLMVCSVSGEEWRAKLSWLVAMLWYKVHNMSESFIEEMLQVVRPARDGVIDVTSEKQSVLDCQHHLQNGLFEVLHKLAGFWLDGKTGKEYVETLQDERLSKVKLSKLKLLDVEDWLELGPRDYFAIWFPVTFVTDAVLWVTAGNSGKGFYQELRLSTLGMLVRVITVFCTGKMNHTTVSNAARIRILNATALREVSKWPALVPKAERPQSVIAWESIATIYVEYQCCDEYKSLVAKLSAKLEMEQKKLEMEKKTVDSNRNASVVSLVDDEADSGKDTTMHVGERGNKGGERSARVQHNGEIINLGEDGVSPDVGNNDGGDGRESVNEETIVEDGEHKEIGVYEYLKVGEKPFLNEELDDIPLMGMELGNEFSTECVGGMGDEKIVTRGLVSLEQFAEIDRENKEDWELDNRISELLRPRLSMAGMADYVSDEAIRVLLMGPIGCARWAALACQEIVNRNDELCLLVDKKIERYKRVIIDVANATQEGIQSVDRLSVLKKDWNEKVDQLKETKKKFGEAKGWVAQQKIEKSRVASGVFGGGNFRGSRLGTVGEIFETPRRQRIEPPRGRKRFSKWSPERPVKVENAVDTPAMDRFDVGGRLRRSGGGFAPVVHDEILDDDAYQDHGGRGRMSGRGQRNWDEGDDYDDYYDRRPRGGGSVRGRRPRDVSNRREPRSYPRGEEEGYRADQRVGHGEKRRDYYSPEEEEWHGSGRDSVYSNRRRDKGRDGRSQRHRDDYHSPRRSERGEVMASGGRRQEKYRNRARNHQRERSESPSMVQERHCRSVRSRHERGASNSQTMAPDDETGRASRKVAAGMDGGVNVKKIRRGGGEERSVGAVSAQGDVVISAGAGNGNEVMDKVTAVEGDKDPHMSEPKAVVESERVGGMGPGGMLNSDTVGQNNVASDTPKVDRGVGGSKQKVGGEPREIVPLNEEVDDDDKLLPS